MLTKKIWTCRSCGYKGEKIVNRRYFCKADNDSEECGPFDNELDAVDAVRDRVIPRGSGGGCLNFTLRIEAECPLCGSQDTYPEDVPAIEGDF